MSQIPDNTPRLSTPDGKYHTLVSPCDIGRSDECAIVLADTQVSRRHCILQSDNRGQWWITDQESTNGTYINGRRISQSTLLRNHDSVTVGNQQFFFAGAKETQAITSPEKPLVENGTKINISQQHCWLLVGDVINSTTLTQNHSPQELINIIGEWGVQSRKIIESHKGEINKFLGDGYFAFWRDTPQLGSSMVTVLKDLSTLKKSLSTDFRMILHYGPVQLGGVMTRGEENLSGSSVNYVFKSEKVAAALSQKIFISDTAASKMSGTLLKSLGVHAVPGFPGENAFFTLELGAE